jgi:hypothetical protein
MHLNRIRVFQYTDGYADGSFHQKDGDKSDGRVHIEGIVAMSGPLGTKLLSFPPTFISFAGRRLVQLPLVAVPR